MKRIKVEYDDIGAYIPYKNKHYHINILDNHFNDIKIIKIEIEPIDTYVVIEEKDSGKEAIKCQ